MAAVQAGLSPHCSSASAMCVKSAVAYAYEQVNRVAKARRLAPARVRKLVAEHVQGRVLGFLGQENVNIVELNHDLAGLM
ncbi:potassium-transporting ATPase subunit C [Streptomyces sp. NPDC021749]|uniref:potassium-transporting ATPase subunit C n=1 Tax=Streptomyces sp. NPDC021749 TaxID=3154905 RepID=UPI0033EB776F